MSKTRQITAAALGISAVVLAVAEVQALRDAQPNDTISEIIADAGAAQPLAMIAVGACAVHFAGGVPALQRTAARHPLLALGLGALVGAAWPLKGLSKS